MSINFFLQKRCLHTEVLHPPRDVAPSLFRALRTILDCSLPQEYGPCFSSIGGDQPLSPPTRRSLGKPLPYQQADATQDTPRAKKLYSCETIRYQSQFPTVIPVSGVCSYALLPILPVPRRAPRLACLIHVASVHPELGSNSTKISVGRNKVNDNHLLVSN